MAHGAETTTKYKVIRSSLCRLERKLTMEGYQIQ